MPPKAKADAKSKTPDKKDGGKDAGKKDAGKKGDKNDDLQKSNRI